MDYHGDLYFYDFRKPVVRRDLVTFRARFTIQKILRFSQVKSYKWIIASRYNSYGDIDLRKEEDAFGCKYFNR